MVESRDAYARLPFRADRTQRALDTGGGLTFFDLADRTTNVDTVAGYLRDVPLDIIGRPAWVLARWGPEHQGWPPAADAADALQKRLTDLGSVATLGVIVFEFAKVPSIVWSSRATGPNGLESVLLARARAAEMGAFVQWGHALWQPETYHYVLPSGKHASSFVRLADAFQDQRAAAALATWLYGSLDPHGPTTVVLDIGTLMPLVGELERAEERHRSAVADSSAGVGTVLSLDRYPSTSLGLQRSLLNVLSDSPMLGLVSVSDSGGFAERLLTVFSAMGTPSVLIEQLVSRRPPGATGVPERSATGGAIENPWLAIEELESTEPDDRHCRLCRDPLKARRVRINPRAMSALILPEPDLVVPDIFDAKRNASLWEAYGRAPEPVKAVGLLGPTETRTVSILERSQEKSVFFEPAQLVKAGTTDFVQQRVEYLKSYPKRNRDDLGRDHLQNTLSLVASRASIIIYDTQERELVSDDEWDALVSSLVNNDFASRDAKWIPHETGREDSTIPSEAGSPSVLILALGARTGLTCQRLFLAARQSWPNANFRCLVVHAHPENQHLWASIRNNFRDSDGSGRLLALWLSCLPSWSPLVVEREIYEAAQEQNLDTEQLRKRLRELEANPLPGHTLLGRANPQLRAHSYFGESLGSRETLCAVGSAMQSARILASQRGAPYSTQFDLQRVFRSYFDGLIHACVLRWCEPQEVWWGTDGKDCCDFLLHLESVDFDFDLLLPELLLACAQEKLPEDAAAQLITTAKKRLSHTADPLDERSRDHIQLGINLCELALDL